MFDDGWHCVFTDAYPLLKEHGMTAVLPLISDYVGKSMTPHRTGTPYGYMNRAEVQEMIDSLGIEIASHTKSHPFLTRLSDEAVDSELRLSRRALEAMFGQEVTSFVYPYGDYDSRVRRLVAEAGYSVARSITPGTVNFSERQYDVPSSEVRKTTSLGTIGGLDCEEIGAGPVLSPHCGFARKLHRLEHEPVRRITGLAGGEQCSGGDAAGPASES